MIDIKNIIEAIREGRVKISDHADEEARLDQLTFDEIYFSIFHGEIIENYPSDKPYPSCLIFGKNFRGDPVHSVWAYNRKNKWAVIITVYRPNPLLWVEGKKRRQ